MRPIITIFSLFALLLSRSVFSQGNLTPPGPPAPTMKTLQQVEPRTDLQNAPAAAVETSTANFHFIINQPGSYYLSANVAVTKASGIQINAEGVTLDLTGFQVARASGTGGDGIQVSLTAHRASVLNGSIKGFAFGINCLDGVNGARGGKWRDLNVSGCTSTAILVGPAGALESCRVHDNTGTSGFSCTKGSTLTNCTASSNTVDRGFSVGVGATLTNCTASSNTCTYGIFADVGSTLTNCNAFNNIGTGNVSAGIATSTGCTITASTAHANIWQGSGQSPLTGVGFYVGSANTIQGCTATLNRGDGIQLMSDSLARGNNCTFNGSSGDGAGIHATSLGNRIEGNNVVGNDRGIDVDAAGNVVVQNTAKQNSINYDIAASNFFGVSVDRTAGVSF